MKLIEERLGNLVTFQRGFDITKKEQAEGTIPVVSSGGISSHHNEAKVEGPGVVIGRKGTLGSVFLLDSSFWPHDTTLWVKDFHGNDPHFVYHFLKTVGLENFDSGAANPTLNRNHIHRLKVHVPETKYRAEIGRIIAEYDQLIENNNQRIALLEEMAEEIYKEWFVRLRFPDYENTVIEEGVPEGWTRGTLGQIINITMGQSPKSEFYNDNKQGLPFHQGVTNFTSRFPQHTSYCSDKKKIAQKGDVLLSVRAPVGRLNIADRELIIGRGLCAIKHVENFQNYCFYILKNIFLIEDSFGNGAVFNAVSKNDIERIKVLIPPDHISRQFDELVATLDEQILILTRQTKSIQKTKSLLLPRLLSGKLTIS